MAVPKLRFKADDRSEFPEWSKDIVGHICLISTGKSNTQDKRDNGKYDFYVRSSKVEKSDKYLYDEEAVLTAGDGVGTGKVFHYVNGKYDLHQRVYRMYNFHQIIGKYFYYYFSQFFYRRVKAMSAKGSVDSVRLEMIYDMPIYLPSLPEQRKIAEFLSMIDDIIQSTESEMTAWQERKKGVMQKIFNREVRFKADDGSEFPEWEEAEIGEICVINPKTEEVEDEFLYMDLGSVDHGDWEEPEVMIKSKAPSRAQRAARVGDVFFQSVRPYNQGHFHYSEKKDKQVVASKVYIQIRMKNCDSGFIYQILYDAHFNQEVSIRCTGSNYPAINADDFSEIVIAYPCVEEQRKIADCLSSLDDVISQIRAELSAWKEFKKGLLQQMFV